MKLCYPITMAQVVLITKKCRTCPTIMKLEPHQGKRKYCRMCQNDRTSNGCARTWSTKLWATKKIKILLPDIEAGT